jgi:hypothetical protein
VREVVVVSICFSFSPRAQEASVQQTLATVAACLKLGGVCLATVVDARALAQLATQPAVAAPAAADVAFGNGAFEVCLTAAAAQRLQALAQGSAQGSAQGAKEANGTSSGPAASPWGVAYLFSLGDAVQRCPEFAVPLPALAALASEAGLDLVHAQVSGKKLQLFFKAQFRKATIFEPSLLSFALCLTLQLAARVDVVLFICEPRVWRLLLLRAAASMAVAQLRLQVLRRRSGWTCWAR